MASAGGIRAGRAFVEIFADDNPLVRGLRSAEAKLKRWGSTVRRAGLEMAAMGGAILAPLYKGMTAFGDFEKQMKMVSTMLNEPQKWMDTYSKGIRKLAVDFGEGTDTLSKGLYDLLSASVDPAKAMDVLAVAVKAAKGGMTDTAVAVDGLTSVLNAFQLSADKASYVSDIMFATVQSGKLTFSQLASNIGKVAPLARAAGMSVEDMSAAIATMTRQGLSAEEATTKLVNILKDVPTEAGDLLALVSKYEGQSLEEIQKVFTNVRSATGIAALSADIKGFTRDIAAMKNSAGAADKAFQKMTGGVTESFDKAKASVIDVLISIGEALGPTLKEAVTWFQKFAKSTGEWISRNKGAVVLALKLGAALVGLGAASIAFGTGLKLIAIPLGLLSTGLSLALGPLRLFGSLLVLWPTIIAAISKPITVLFIIMGKLTKIVPMLKTAWVALTATFSLLLNPVTLVIAGIAALGVTILATQGFFTRALSSMGKMFGDLKNDAVAAFKGISDALAAGDIARAMKILWLTIKLEYERVVMEMHRAWLDFCGSFKKFGVDAWNGLLLIMNEVISEVESLWSSMVNTLSEYWNGFFDTIKKSWNWIRNNSKYLGLAGYAVSISDEDYKKNLAAIEGEAKAREDARKRALALEKQSYTIVRNQIIRESAARIKAIEDENNLKLRVHREAIARALKEQQAVLKGIAPEAGGILDPTKWTGGAVAPATSSSKTLGTDKELLKTNEELLKVQNDINVARQMAALQGGGVNLQEEQRQRLLQAYKEMAAAPGFDEQSESAQELRTQIESLQTPMQSFIGQLQAIPPMWQQIGTVMFNTVQTFTQGIGNAVAQVIVYGESFGKLMTQLGKQIAAQIISSLVGIGVQWLITSAMSLLGIGITLTAAMKSYAAQTFAATYASISAIPIIGPAMAPAAAGVAVGTMLAGAAAAGAVGAGVGAGMSAYDKGGISMHPQLAAVSERGRPELHLTRPNIQKFFPELMGGIGRPIYLDSRIILDGRVVGYASAKYMPNELRLRGAV